MIAHLTGKILSKQPNQVVLDVGGVGYDVTIPLSTFYDLGEDGASISLHIYTHVREETIALYGFRTYPEKRVFEKLISVSGIGPRLGIAILSGMSVDELVPAIQRNDVARLTHIPGIGRKTAERLVLELPAGQGNPPYGDRITGRAIAIIDKAGKVAWFKQYDIPVVPDIKEVAAALSQVK